MSPRPMANTKTWQPNTGALVFPSHDLSPLDVSTVAGRYEACLKIVMLWGILSRHHGERRKLWIEAAAARQAL